jgi:hypothetical protein
MVYVPLLILNLFIIRMICNMLLQLLYPYGELLPAACGYGRRTVTRKQGLFRFWQEMLSRNVKSVKTLSAATSEPSHVLSVGPDGGFQRSGSQARSSSGVGSGS